MPEIRTILDGDILSLKGATEACFILGGGPTSFASMTRVGVSTLSKYASNSDEFRESLIPIDVAVEADRRAGSPIIIKEAARQLGYQLAPLQDALRSGTRISERDAHVILSEAMDVSKALITAFEDGKVDAFERKQLRKELRELVRAAEDILHRMEDE